MRTRPIAAAARGALAVAAVLAGALLAGCDMCEVGDLRCQGNVVQECSATRNWETLHDCGTATCGVSRDVCHPLIDFGGNIWCCY